MRQYEHGVQELDLRGYDVCMGIPPFVFFGLRFIITAYITNGGSKVLIKNISCRGNFGYDNVRRQYLNVVIFNPWPYRNFIFHKFILDFLY